METLKAYERRLREGFFEHCKGSGLDVGAGSDPLVTPFGTIRPYDKTSGDANTLANIADESFDFVYSSHCLEHLDTPHIALQNWFRAVKPNGYLIVVVPHRDLYEKKKLLPSRYNPEHRSFWLPEKSEPPHTFGLREFVHRWLLTNREIISIKACQDGCTELSPDKHSIGEYSIECIIRKRGN